MEVPKCRVYICLITSAVPQLQVLGWAGGGGGGGGGGQLGVLGVFKPQTLNPIHPTPRTLNPKPGALHQVFSGLGFKGVWSSAAWAPVQGSGLEFRNPKTPKPLNPKP